MDIRNVIQNSFNVSTIADYQRMVVTGHTFVTLPDTINTFIINVSLDNRVKYNDIPSSVFGNNTTYIAVFLSLLLFFQVFLDQLLISGHQLTTVLISV